MPGCWSNDEKSMFRQSQEHSFELTVSFFKNGESFGRKNQSDQSPANRRLKD
jgi:hypothetical protein